MITLAANNTTTTHSQVQVWPDRGIESPILSGGEERQNDMYSPTRPGEATLDVDINKFQLIARENGPRKPTMDISSLNSINARTGLGRVSQTITEEMKTARSIYEKAAKKRMGMKSKTGTEQVCVYYSQDIYRDLMDAKAAGKLGDYKPRIYGFDTGKQSELGAFAARHGKTSATNFSHRVAVLEDKNGKPVMFMDPWQTGPLYQDSLTTYFSREEYLNERGPITFTGVRGTLRPLPADEEAAELRQARVRVGQ